MWLGYRNNEELSKGGSSPYLTTHNMLFKLGEGPIIHVLNCSTTIRPQLPHKHRERQNGGTEWRLRQ